MAYGLRLYDGEDNVIFDPADYFGKLIHSETVSSGVLNHTTISGFNDPQSPPGLQDLINYIDIWALGDWAIKETGTYPGMWDHWYTQGMIDDTPGEDFYDYWEGELLPSEFIEEMEWASLAAGYTIDTDTLTSDIEDDHQDRWEALYDAGVSGTHPYNSNECPLNLYEIGEEFDIDYDAATYWDRYDDYTGFTKPYSQADGASMMVAMGYMNTEITDETDPYSFSYVAGYCVTLAVDTRPHSVSLSLIGNTDLRIGMHPEQWEITGGDFDSYMYSGDCILYVIGYG